MLQVIKFLGENMDDGKMFFFFFPNFVFNFM